MVTGFFICGLCVIQLDKLMERVGNNMDKEIGLTKKELDKLSIPSAYAKLKDSSTRYRIDGEGNTYFYPLSALSGVSLSVRWTLLTNYQMLGDKISLNKMQEVYAPYKYQDLLAIQTMIMVDRFCKARTIKKRSINTLTDFVERVEPGLAKQKLSRTEAMLYELASAVVNDYGYRRGDYLLDTFDGLDVHELNSMQQFINYHILDVLHAYVNRVHNDMYLRHIDANIRGSINGQIRLYETRNSQLDNNLKAVLGFLQSLQTDILSKPSEDSVLAPGWDLGHALQRFIYDRLIGGYYSNYSVIDKNRLAINFKDVYGFELNVDKLIALEKRVWEIFHPDYGYMVYDDEVLGSKTDIDDGLEQSTASGLVDSQADNSVTATSSLSFSDLLSELDAQRKAANNSQAPSVKPDDSDKK